MRAVLLALSVCLGAAVLSGATFGTVVPLVGGASDLVLDEGRGRLYVVNNNQNRVEVYSTAQRRFLDPVRTDTNPVSAALSRDGSFLYVTSYDASALNIIDLNSMAVVRRVTLPARPEGVAVGNDGFVLISTIGTGTNNAQSVLLIFDPQASDSNALAPVPIQPPAPTTPTFPAPAGRPYLVSRSQLMSSADGAYIVGVNLPNTNSRAVFVYEVASRTVLRSRVVANISSVMAIAPDNSRFMSGLTLFDLQTLEVLAQQNTANSPYPFTTGTNFNTQTNQGGSVFSPDGSVLYSAFDVAPINSTRTNISQLLLNDPDNLLIKMGLQLPENLAGKMIISSDGGTIYAISESGFVTVPVGTMKQNPLAVLDTQVVLLANDQCAYTAGMSSQVVPVRNDGRGRLTVTATLQDSGTTTGIGGIIGPGGGIPGGGGIIVTPSGATAATAPRVRNTQVDGNPALQFDYTSAASARNPGTVSPSHTYLLSSNEAINIPPAIKVFQNFRNTEAAGEIVPVPTLTTTAEGLVDLALDSTRNRLYIANSAMNRIEVFDTRAKKLLDPIKVGQLPRSLAIAPDGNTMYVANTGGENIGIVDLSQGKMIGRVHFPPVAFNVNAALVTPAVIAATQRGALFLMNNGTIWKLVGTDAVPRATSPVIGTATLSAPRQIASTPGGEYAIVLAGNGFVYLYDSLADEFVQGRQVFTTFQGYYGPISAGPRGAFYVVNGTVLNQSLTPISNAGTMNVTVRPGASGAVSRPIAAVAAAGNNTVVRFVAPFVAAANTAATDTGSVELADINSGLAQRSVTTLEGPVSIPAGVARANVDGRTIVMDPNGTTAYVVTFSGLSIVNFDTATGPSAAASRPAINSGGVVNLGSYSATFAPNSLFTIFGRNLGNDGTVPDGSTAPTTMGGICVTLNNSPIPLLMTSAGQVNAQIPPEIAAGRYPLVIRSGDRKVASTSQTITVAKYAPAVLQGAPGLVALFRPNGGIVNAEFPAKRDEPLSLYAIGLGVPKGAKVSSGTPSPSNPAVETDPLKVYFGNPGIKEAEVIVDWAGLDPGSIGVYRIDLRVPGAHLRGSALPVTIRIGGVDSPQKPVAATVPVD